LPSLMVLKTDWFDLDPGTPNGIVVRGENPI